jgi:cytosine/uracil/thiamine/allantoin permease
MDLNVCMSPDIHACILAYWRWHGNRIDSILIEYAFIGVAVTSATTIIYGQTIWDPTDVLARFKNPVLLIVAMLALYIATLATNIAANVVSPANDFSHLAPRRISFRTGGLITGIVGVLIMPWKLVHDPLIELYNYAWFVGFALASVIYLVLRKIAPKS